MTLRAADHVFQIPVCKASYQRLQGFDLCNRKFIPGNHALNRSDCFLPVEGQRCIGVTARPRRSATRRASSARDSTSRWAAWRPIRRPYVPCVCWLPRSCCTPDFSTHPHQASAKTRVVLRVQIIKLFGAELVEQGANCIQKTERLQLH